ncbi:hypothetical protein ACWD3Z_35775 [Streptomyces sp. NPDC002740]
MTTFLRWAPQRITGGRDAEPAARRQAVLGEARLRIAVELGYPSDIGAQCAAVRREVTEQLRTWAGLEVSDLQVSVERLHSVQARPTDQERVR